MKTTVMKNYILTLGLILLASSVGHSQTWEEMAQYTMELEFRNDSSDLWLNDSVKVELRDYGINEFTIFRDTTSQSGYFIYRCACGDTVISLIGGRDRIHDFYRLRDIIYESEEWLITKFDTEIALSVSWNIFESKSRRKMNKRCLMTIN